MRVDAFTYELPEELIAQRPAAEREHARLMHLSREPREPAGAGERHLRIADLPDLVPSGALVVVNDTRVLPARLLGQKASGGRVEIFLVRRMGRSAIDGSPTPVDRWEALGRSSKPLRPGMDIEVHRRASAMGPPALTVRVLARDDAGGLEVALSTPDGGSIDDALRACGHVPLPPYIRRADDESDADRYQTVYAREDGAVAAPTAGLHLTEALLARIRARGCDVATVTLHVGLGTFQPVEVDDLDAHPMHAERCLVPSSTVEAIASARRRGAPVLAVGTTTARALESAADREQRGHARVFEDDTRLLIQPGYAWRVVDVLLTNFHLPRSTLLAMVCALGGTDRVLAAYREAVAARYRFFSYGDAMLLWRSA
ncbi:MAG: tRNA preQ1(34) S-adenosylmethionine ribosyltransferase-isomerase QueA [Polyangiaceae bacterium]